MRPEADPALFALWVRGWTQTRGVPAPIAVAGGWRVDAVKPDHRWRFLYPGVDGAIGDRARAPLAGPFHLKVAAAADRVIPLLPPGWVIDDSTSMMTRAAGAATVPVLPTGYRIVSSAPLAGVTRIDILDEGGTVAAHGQIALIDDLAVFDQIVTSPAHRRCGLGRTLMTALGRLADAGGAASWMLAATTEGAALYATLGWERHSPYLTAMPPTEIENG